MPNVTIQGTARENQHEGYRQSQNEQDQTKGPALPFPSGSRFLHGLPGAVTDDPSMGSSSIFRRGLVSSNQAAVRSLMPRSINTSRICSVTSVNGGACWPFACSSGTK